MGGGFSLQENLAHDNDTSEVGTAMDNCASIGYGISTCTRDLGISFFINHIIFCGLGL